MPVNGMPSLATLRCSILLSSRAMPVHYRFPLLVHRRPASKTCKRPRLSFLRFHSICHSTLPSQFRLLSPLQCGKSLWLASMREASSALGAAITIAIWSSVTDNSWALDRATSRRHTHAHACSNIRTTRPRDKDTRLSGLDNFLVNDIPGHPQVKRHGMAWHVCLCTATGFWVSLML